jgi:hypothetical protein
MSWNKVTTIPKSIFFGCAGNPNYVGEISTSLFCSCGNTFEKHLKNYKKYLYHKENYQKLNLTCVKCTDKNLSDYY